YIQLHVTYALLHSNHKHANSKIYTLSLHDALPVTVKSNENGTVDIEDLKRVVSDKTAAIMLTNPNTLGLFEKDILEIRDIVHGAGGKLYYDGANLNAIMAKVRPGDMGCDAVHLNLHKTFTGPHGGGGPGSGPIGVKADLAEFLPKPHVKKEGDTYKR